MMSRFPANSRYHGLETKEFERPDGEIVPYLERRFVPHPGDLALLGEHVVEQGDRLDRITARHLGDPEQFWRVCDANSVMRPEELTEEIGRRLRITLPEGVPGAPDATQ